MTITNPLDAPANHSILMNRLPTTPPKHNPFRPVLDVRGREVFLSTLRSREVA
jgi:hypothetical protein